MTRFVLAFESNFWRVIKFLNLCVYLVRDAKALQEKAAKKAAQAAGAATSGGGGKGNNNKK